MTDRNELEVNIGRRLFLQKSSIIGLVALAPSIVGAFSLKGQSKNYKMIKKLSFSTDLITASVAYDTEVVIQGHSIVFNASNEPLVVDELTWIAPWQSATLVRTVIKPVCAVIIQVVKTEGLAAECLSKWRNLQQLLPDFPKERMLYISEQETICRTSLNPLNFGSGNYNASSMVEFEVKLNLWYTPPYNDCGIHTGHKFLEVHTQIYGEGSMQAFKTEDENSLYRELSLLPGNTHGAWFKVDGRGKWTYPWHRYLSRTDCVWMAVEFHPVGK